VRCVYMTISEKFYTIKKACDQMKMCEVWLKDEPSPRIVQPLGICLTIKRGLIIVCKQTAGHFTKKGLPKTCNFPLDDLQKIRILEKKFELEAESYGQECEEWLVQIRPNQLSI
jgi:hypothetical protein